MQTWYVPISSPITVQEPVKLTMYLVLGVSATLGVSSRHLLMFSSFHVGNPEGIHQLLVLFSDRGTPRSIRFLNSYSGHTYKFTKEVRLYTMRVYFICSPTKLGWFVQVYQDPHEDLSGR